MKLTIAKSAGYCFGVKRAVNMVYQEAEEAKVPVYTYGPIIHNEEVVRDLKQRGVHVVRELKELENLPKGKIIIRSHGISRREHEAMKACGFEVLDATCPFVLKIHRLVEKYSKETNITRKWKEFSDGWKDSLPIRSQVRKILKNYR